MQGHFRMECSFVITCYFHDLWVWRCFCLGAKKIQNGEFIHDIGYSEGYCGHCGLKVLLGQKHSRLLRTFLICVHGHWDLSFILDHCCSEESCGHCGFKVPLLRWQSRMLRAFLILVTLRSVHGHCGLKVLFGANALARVVGVVCDTCYFKEYCVHIVFRCLWCIYSKEWMTFNLRYFYFWPLWFQGVFGALT